MTIPIKIQCGCGQRYSFEIEPSAGRMPGAVSCPVCGADGTAAANSMIAQHLSAAQPVIQKVPVGRVLSSTDDPAPAAPARIHLAAAPAAAPASTPSAPPPRRLGQMDPAQVRVEARSKLFWGDPPGQVLKFMMMQDFSHEEASAYVNEIVAERAVTLRGIGIRKLVCGVGLMAVPVVTFFVSLSVGVFITQIIAVAVMAGLWGAWMALRGATMLLFPKSEHGDVADQ